MAMSGPKPKRPVNSYILWTKESEQKGKRRAGEDTRRAEDWEKLDKAEKKFY